MGVPAHAQHARSDASSVPRCVRSLTTRTGGARPANNEPRVTPHSTCSSDMHLGEYAMWLPIHPWRVAPLRAHLAGVAPEQASKRARPRNCAAAAAKWLQALPRRHDTPFTGRSPALLVSGCRESFAIPRDRVWGVWPQCHLFCVSAAMWWVEWHCTIAARRVCCVC